VNETALHIFAKSVIQKSRKFRIPPIEIINSRNDSQAFYQKDVFVPIDSVETEKKIGTIVPDIVINTSGHRLLVEIFVTHSVDSEKLKIIRELGISTVEIDLSSAVTCDDLLSVENEIINEVSSKRWLFSNKADEIKKRIEKRKSAQKTNPQSNEIDFPDHSISESHSHTASVILDDPRLPFRKKTKSRREPSENEKIHLGITPVKCKICSKLTRSWTVLDTSNNSCICRDCLTKIRYI